MIKEPIYNYDLEKYVLGAAFCNSNAADRVCTLKRNDFYKMSHKHIFDMICRLRKSNYLIDMITMVTKLGNEYAELIANIAGETITDVYLEQHIKELREITIERMLGVKPENIEDIKALIDDLEKLPEENAIIKPEDIERDTLEYYRKGGIPGTSTGYDSLDKFYNISKGQLTAVTGIPSSGKSEFIDQIAVNLAYNHGWKFMFFSPENFPISRHIRKIVEKYAGMPMFPGYKENMSEKDLIESLKWINAHFKFLNIKPSNRTVDFILSQIHNIDGFVLDPWNEIESSRPNGMSETEFISQCLMKIKAFAVVKKVHIWVVAHPTKLHKNDDGSYPVPTPYDISGSAHWRNKSDNCIAIHRVGLEHRIECHVQKVRFKDNGQPGVCYFDYDYATGVFNEHQ